MDMVNDIMAYESGEMDEGEMIEFFRKLIESGMINHLQGHYQRTAADLVDVGLL